MGLKQDLINAKIESLKLAGAPEPIPTEAVELQCEMEKEAIVNFLTKCQFRITQLNAPVIVEDFKIPPQQGDVLPTVMAAPGIPIVNGFGPGTTTAPGMLQGGTGGVLTKKMDINKDVGGLQSTGYVYIGGDPDSQDAFDVSDLEGIRDFTSVELFREDIEDLL